MPTLTATEARSERTEGHILLHGVSWELYERLLEELAEQHVSITYDEGSLEIMSPLPAHERWKGLIGRLIEILALVWNVPMPCFGSTTFKRKDLGKGLEPDECYYVRNAARVKGKRRLVLPKDPPPDLVVEVDITHRAIEKERVYAAMGVPEVWRFDGERLHVLVLSRGAYRPSAKSLAFPSLSISELRRFLEMFETTDDETAVARAFHDWLKEAKA